MNVPHEEFQLAVELCSMAVVVDTASVEHEEKSGEHHMDDFP